MISTGGGQAPPAGGHSLSQHIARTLRLAVPAMLGRAGMLILITVDSVMTGHAGARELAHYGLSLAPFQIIMVIGIGLLAGTPVLIAQRHGANRPGDCAAIWRVGLLIGGLLGLFGGLALQAGEPLFLVSGQSPDMAAGAARALAMHALGLPAMMLFFATTFFLEAIARPSPGMVVALGANFVNVALNWLLIEGHIGAPAMGASGAALATAITRWVMLTALLAYVFNMRGADLFGVLDRFRIDMEAAQKSIRLGAPLGVTTGLEVSAFALVATFAGQLGEVAMAGYQAAMNVVALVFMLSIGLAVATAVRVANAVGREDHYGIAVAAWIGLGLNILLMVVLGVAMALDPELVAALYTDDPAVLRVATAGMVVVAAMLLVDGAQAVLASAARAAGDVIVPMVIYAVAFWGIGVPLAYYYGLRLEMGVPWLLGCMGIALTIAAVALGIRFHIIVRRGIRPI